jgi:hypothetical protein
MEKELTRVLWGGNRSSASGERYEAAINRSPTALQRLSFGRNLCDTVEKEEDAKQDPAKICG